MPFKSLINLQELIPTILVELKYATKENFTGHILYDFQEAYLVLEAASKLKEVQEALAPMGLGLKVWDAYRPLAVQWKFWNLLPDKRFVSDPREGGRHSRGTAVDLTLVKEGTELAMPSRFDEFSLRASRDYKGASEEQIKHRHLLQSVMENHGFEGLRTEWWHFDLIGWQQYPVI